MTKIHQFLDKILNSSIAKATLESQMSVILSVRLLPIAKNDLFNCIWYLIWAYWSSTVKPTIEPIDLWSSFTTFKPLGLLNDNCKNLLCCSFLCCILFDNCEKLKTNSLQFFKKLSIGWFGYQCFVAVFFVAVCLTIVN